MLSNFTESDWIENFRMSRCTFNVLSDKLRSSIERKSTRFRKPISTEKRLAVTLWFFATTAEYRTISHLFGIARSTVCEIVWETASAIVHHFLSTYIKFPVGDQAKSVKDGFQTKWNVPQCLGAIDGSHIPVRPPICNHTDYNNRKALY